MEELSDKELAADGESLEDHLLVDADTEADETLLQKTQPGEYIAYSGDLSYAETGDVVLFFHALTGVRAVEGLRAILRPI